FWSGTDTCGGWLVCECGGAVGLSAAGTPLSRASPLPHLDGGGCGILVGHKISVGAGLPAMAVGQVSLSAAGTVLTELGVTDQAALS
ncbi:hypothetical protein, partial [Enterococcus faecalis]|uniref:hypothetical protein n=1 Tax=Enterococcus faecalis TaxID=1351 RepID=UPI003CC5F865